MAKKKNQNLFSRLTQLFRSGPVVKRKVRDYKAPTASSALDVFKHSARNVYGHQAGALGGFDRLCVDMDTRIAIPSTEGFRTLNELMETYKNGEKFIVYAFNHKSETIVPAWAHHPRVTGDKETVKISFSNGKELICTPDHPCMLSDGTYRDGGDLKEGDVMLSLRYIDNCEAGHLVVSCVEKWEKITVGDLTVDGYENFATDSILVHNSRYGDFCEMDYTPEISSGLDIFAEETAACDENGQVLHIFSENPKIKGLLDDLFYDTLNVEFNLTPWVRSLVKFGDFALLHDVDPSYGILNVFPIPINEFEREEGFDPKDPLAVRFRWTTNGNQILENWQVSHFRLLGNDSFLPYGTSALESARRVWRQLVLVEDAMLVYRVVRSPERRVFYIDVANIAPEDIGSYMEQAKTTLKSNQVIDKSSGRVDMRYNPLPISENSLIPLLDGRTITIKQLAAEYEAQLHRDDLNPGDETPENGLWVYSLKDDVGPVVPGRVAWCGKNYTAERIYRVTLDDGTWIDAAGEHPFILRDGKSRRADDLRENDRLMPFYRKISDIGEGDQVDGYEMIYDPSSEKYEYTHRAIAADWCVDKERVIPERGGGQTIHHMDHQKWNNSPTNLQRMGHWEHKKHHAEANQTPEHRQQVARTNIKYGKQLTMIEKYMASGKHAADNAMRSEVQNAIWSDPDQRKYRTEILKWQISDEMLDYAAKIVRDNPKIFRKELDKLLRDDKTFMQMVKDANPTSGRNPQKFCASTLSAGTDVQYTQFRRECVKGDIKKLIHRERVKRQNQINEIDDTTEETEGEYKNHSVVSVEILKEKTDVYCMIVVGMNKEENRHNFAVVSSGFNDETGISSLRADVLQPRHKGEKPQKELVGGTFIRNSVDEDYFLPIRGTESGTRIESLPGGQNVTAIEDINYIQSKLFAALKIPKAFLGYDESLSSKATLSQEDIRFSRTINRMQRTVLAELNKMAIIHLFSHGYDGPELLNFDLQLSNPSTVAQQQKLELWRTKFEIAGTSPEGMVDRRFLRKRILMLTDDEIEDIESGRLRDRQIDMQVEGQDANDAKPSGGGGGGMGGGGGGLGSPTPPPSEEEEKTGAEAAGAEAGGDASLADLLSGGEPGSEEPEEGADEEPPEESDRESDEKLLIDLDIDDDLRLSIQDDDAPVKAQNQLGRALHNRKRRVHNGRRDLSMPDHHKMVSHGRQGDGINDPYDSDWIKSPLRDGLETDDDPIMERFTAEHARMTEELRRTLKTLGESRSRGIPNHVPDEIDDLTVEEEE